MWTTFKNHRTSLKGKGYTKNFLSLNARATNEYKDTYVLGYCCNRFMKPTIDLFFKKRDINISHDGYALSEMIQWIWRSRIREGQSIELFIPSKRMRELLKDYLSQK